MRKAEIAKARAENLSKVGEKNVRTKGSTKEARDGGRADLPGRPERRKSEGLNLKARAGRGTGQLDEKAKEMKIDLARVPWSVKAYG